MKNTKNITLMKRMKTNMLEEYKLWCDQDTPEDIEDMDEIDQIAILDLLDII